MNKVYVGNLFTGEDDRDTYQDYCYLHKIYAIGWAIDTIPNSIDEYKTIARNVFRNKEGKENRGLNMAISAIEKLESGDFIWTRYSKTGQYLLGKVAKNGQDITSADFHHLYESKNGNDVYCLSVPCEKWEIFNMDQVPGIILNSFRGQTIKQSSHSQHIINYCSNIFYKTEPSRQDVLALKSFLSPDDEEDLLGMYLQKKEHYLMYPSTNKRETDTFEYMLAKEKDDGSIQKAIIQCKMGNTDIELEDFEDYKTFKIYCVTDEGEVKYKGNTYKGDKPNIHVLSLMDLLIWAKDKDNIDILPDRIRENLKITDF